MKGHKTFYASRFLCAQEHLHQVVIDLILIYITDAAQARIMLKAGNIEAADLLLSRLFGTQHRVADPSATMKEVRVVQAALRLVRPLALCPSRCQRECTGETELVQQYIPLLRQQETQAFIQPCGTNRNF